MKCCLLQRHNDTANDAKTTKEATNEDTATQRQQEADERKRYALRITCGASRGTRLGNERTNE